VLKSIKLMLGSWCNSGLG